MTKSMTLLVRAATPSAKATHVEVRVTHRDKRVRLDVDPVLIGRGMVQKTFDLTSRRKSHITIMDMPRLAPKKFDAVCDLIAHAVSAKDENSAVWPMIREAAAEGGITVSDPVMLD